MGLTERLACFSAPVASVLVVPVPGQDRLRWAVEDALDDTGWQRATSPAYADLLVECGEAGPELAECVSVAWDAMPGPRERLRLSTPDGVLASLREVARCRADLPAHRRDARTRSAPRLGGDQGHDGMDGMDGMDSDSGGMDMAMDMDLPGGLTLADRMQDRDGLRLEGLRPRWGPLLPDWPAGLVLDLELSGDLIRSATARILDAGAGGADAAPSGAPAALDALAGLLGAAGWDDGARRCRRARGAADRSPGSPADDAARADVRRRVARARLLRWSARGLRAPDGLDIVEHLDRLLDATHGRTPLPRATLADLDAALRGCELGAARLVVAAYGPALVRTESAAVAHG